MFYGPHLQEILSSLSVLNQQNFTTTLFATAGYHFMAATIQHNVIIISNREEQVFLVEDRNLW